MKIKKPTTAVMESKRKATSDLNHDNWDREDEPEEKGTFQTAPEEVLKNRVIKKAKRNLSSTETGESKSLFSGFTGFSSGASVQPASNSPFSFLSKITPNPPPYSGNAPKKETPATAAPEQKSENKFGFEKSNTYYSKLTNLNIAVSEWIKTHVDKNPLCLLTPIFNDYEKYLKEIQEERPDRDISSTASSTSDKFIGSDAKKILKTDENPSSKQPTFSFGAVNSTTDNKSTAKSGGSIFGSSPAAKNDTVLNTFTFKPSQSVVEPSSSKSSIFSNASSTSTAESSNTAFVTGFSFSSSKPFTFGGNITANANPTDTGSKEEEAEEDEPPKVEFTPVVEEDYAYSKRCKVFVKNDGNYSDRGIGTLYLKPVKDSDKTQLIVRADTNLGNILLNFILNDSIPAQRLGKNNVMIVCVPTPESEQKPKSVLLRVKTGEEADELLATINKYKK